MDYVLRYLRKHLIPLVVPTLTAGRLWLAAEFGKLDMQNYDIAVVVFTAVVACSLWYLLGRRVCAMGCELLLGFVLIVLTSLTTEIFLIAVQFAGANNPMVFSNLQQQAEQKIVDLALNATAIMFQQQQ